MGPLVLARHNSQLCWWAGATIVRTNQFFWCWLSASADLRGWRRRKTTRTHQIRTGWGRLKTAVKQNVMQAILKTTFLAKPRALKSKHHVESLTFPFMNSEWSIGTVSSSKLWSSSSFCVRGDYKLSQVVCWSLHLLSIYWY